MNDTVDFPAVSLSSLNAMEPFKSFYSNRRASMGSSRDAFIAG